MCPESYVTRTVLAGRRQPPVKTNRVLAKDAINSIKIAMDITRKMCVSQLIDDANTCLLTARGLMEAFLEKEK